jgi:pyruvate formate lyase activating enzyme
MLMDANFYEKQKDKIKCRLCPHGCVLEKGKFGLCSVRTNKEGRLKTINYGEITSMSQDPIEKKPLYHFKPGAHILSVGSFGCNFSCGFCQNYSISQHKANSEFMPPEKLIDLSQSLENNIGLAFTYNEPSIWYEYVYDAAKLLKNTDINSNVVLVTNGYIEMEPLMKLLPYVDAMNIDLKAFNDKYYNSICGGSIKPVLETIKIAAKHCHVEITTLLVNNENDSEEEVGKVASFLANIDKDIPLHLSRYFPNYKMEQPPTEVKKMIKAKEIASQYLNYIYLGNLSEIDNSTYCPDCGEELIDRRGYSTNVKISKNVCPKCGLKLNIVL